MNIELNWTEFKQIAITNKLIVPQFQDKGYGYFIWAVEGPVIYSCNVTKSDPRNDDQVDFEDNYKATCNLPADPKDDDGKLFVRNEVRPLGQGAYFSSAGDDAVLGIGQGKRIDWDFTNTEDQITIDEDWKAKIIDVQFKDHVYVRGGFLTYRNSQDECMIDMGVICPSGQYYLNSSGAPTLATEDVWVSRYVNKFDMDGDNPGIYIDGGTASTAIPTNYKMRFQITTKTADVSSRGHVAMMLYRSRTVDLPS